MLRSLLSASKNTTSAVSARAFSTSSRAATIGVLGLGQMGYSMARNVFERYGKPNNESVVVYDINKSTVDRFVSEHSALQTSSAKIIGASTPAEVAEQADVIVTMLPTPKHVYDAYLGENGIARVSAHSKKLTKPNVLFIDSSTIDPATSREVAAGIAQVFGTRTDIKADFVDAPVSGGTMGAQNGTLTFMVGAADVEVFERAKPVLSGMGKNIVHCGGVGTGEVAKICNNMLLGITMLGAAEAMNLGVKLGMDPKMLHGILATSTGRSWSVDTCNPCPGTLEGVPSSRGYTGGFGIKLMSKDLTLASKAADSVHAETPLGKFVDTFYRQVGDIADYGDKDFSVVYKYLRKEKPSE
ncbi:3-hydroxyisobutyrate dehydrogenase [Ramicandelaber brevisporus]|nr:3-hydroxyisobutyrate dehydrogenase [Ramicandelaber brevisporus]